MPKAPRFEDIKDQLSGWWANCRITRNKQTIEQTAKRLYSKKTEFYDPVERDTGVPWWMVAVIDQRESGARGGVLHNGEFIIGKGRKTRLVPAGRGPFSTWHQAAVDALTMPGKRLDKVGKDNWSIELALYHMEAFNGWGYRQYRPNTPSPYIWSCTNIYDNSPRGKYVADGKWKAGVLDTQIGCAPLLKALLELDKPKVAVETTTGAVAGGATATTVALMDNVPLTDYILPIVISTVSLAALFGIVAYWYKKRIKRKVEANVAKTESRVGMGNEAVE